MAAVSSAGSPTVSAATTAAAESAANDPALAKFRTNGINLLYITNPPYSEADGQGNVTGAGPVVMAKILNALGITKLNYQLVDFGNEIPAITSGRGDLTANNFNATAARCAQVAFTNPVAFYNQGALVKMGNPKKLTSYDDIKSTGAKVALERGSAAIAWLEQNYGVPASQISQFDTVQEAVTAVNQGRADVYLNATQSLETDLKLPGITTLELANPFKGPVIDGKEIITNASYALPYADSALLNDIDAEIAAMEQSGEMAQLLEPYGYPAASIAKPTDSGKSINPTCKWPENYVDTANG